MEQIQRLRTEKDQIFLPVRKDADNLQTVVSAAEEAGDVMHLSQNVVETFIDRIEVFNDERVKIRFTFEDICVLQRKDRKAIAITPCAAEHPMSFKVPGRLLTDGQCRMMINGIQFIQVLLEANGLAAGKDHQFKGRYDAEKNAVIISLEKDEQSALSPQKCTT